MAVVEMELEVGTNEKSTAMVELELEVGPNEESMAMVAPAVQMAFWNRPGGGKIRSGIPKNRKLVKTMMYYSIMNFVKSLFFPPPSNRAGDGAPP